MHWQWRWKTWSTDAVSLNVTHGSRLGYTSKKLFTSCLGCPGILMDTLTLKHGDCYGKLGLLKLCHYLKEPLGCCWVTWWQSRMVVGWPNPQGWTPTIWTWDVTSLSGKEPELVQEAEHYQLQVAGLAPTHSLWNLIPLEGLDSLPLCNYLWRESTGLWEFAHSSPAQLSYVEVHLGEWLVACASMLGTGLLYLVSTERYGTVFFECFHYKIDPLPLEGAIHCRSDLGRSRCSLPLIGRKWWSPIIALI